MFKSKHQIEVYEGKRGGFFWRARFIGKGAMANKIVADGSQPYSTKSNARRAGRRIGRALAFAPIINIEVDHA